MRPTRAVLRSTLACAAALTLAADAAAFRLLAPNPGSLDDFVDTVAPHVFPPFVHWDLREFAGCTIPWQIHPDGVADLNGNLLEDDVPDAFLAFADAFAAWEAVTPALIGFTPSGDPGAKTGIALDGFNLLSFGANAIPGDDVQVLPVGQGDPNEIGVLPGLNTLLESVPAGDDFELFGAIVTGADGICDTPALFDDDQVIPFGNGYPFSTCVSPGADGFLQTQPRDDDEISGNLINSGPDGVCDSEADNQLDLDANTLALTGLFFNNQSGVLIESDIVFNTLDFTWSTGAHGALPAGGRNDLQTVATHEIGHFIGFGHPSDDDFMNPAGPVMNGLYDHLAVNNHELHADDEDACNFDYNHDLGDAPHYDDDFSEIFSSLVHGDTVSRTLNEQSVFVPWAGPAHKFGIKPRQARNYTYEWIGTSPGSDVDSECEADIVDDDEYDDGVRLIPNPPVWGEPLAILVDVKTASDAQVPPQSHDYATHPLYVNAWIDLNVNDEWEEGAEHVIDNFELDGAGTASGVALLPETEEDVWVRVRLDWDEQVTASGLSPDLVLHEGAAQFGEVEDFPLACVVDIPTVAPWGEILLGCLLFTAVALEGYRRWGGAPTRA